jgi:hypothetical protein
LSGSSTFTRVQVQVLFPAIFSKPEAKSAQVEYLLLRLKQALIHLPPVIYIVEFAHRDSKPVSNDHGRFSPLVCRD